MTAKQSYSMLNNCSVNARKAGMSHQADMFAARASQCQWVPSTKYIAGTPLLSGQAYIDAATYATKKEAEAAARAIGFPLRMVEQVCSRFCLAWGIRDCRFGYLSTHWLDEAVTH